MKSKISQARHRVTSGVGGRIVNGYDNMPVYRLGDLPAGARYRTSDAVRIRGFNTSDTSPKYDKNLTTEMQGEQSLSSYSAESNNNYGKNDYYYENVVRKYNKYRLSTAVKGAKHRVAGTMGDMIVNYTPDIYDAPKNKDTSTHAAMKLGGNAFMATRTGYRTVKSVQRGTWKLRKSYHDNRVGKKHDIKSAKMSRNLKYSTGINVRRSVRKVIRNQSRKAVNRIAQNNDTATGIVGKSMRLTINSVKYRKQVYKGARTIKRLIASLINTVVGLISSLPALLVTVMSAVPFTIVVIVVTVVISLVTSYNDTCWGLQSLLEQESALETEFGIDIDIVELSCVQDALGWSRSITYSQMERLVAYYYVENPYLKTYLDRDDKYYCSNPRDARKTDFDTGLKRVFDKHNPAKRFNNNDKYGVNSEIDKGDILYGNMKAMNLPDLNFYKEYKQMKLGNDATDPEVRAYYGSSQKINERIAFAKSRYNTNLGWYAIYGTANDLPSNEILAKGTVAQKAVELGKAKLGCRYYWGAEGPTYFDCSGYVYWCYSNAGYSMERGTASSYRKLGIEIPKDISQLKEGDLLLINWNGKGIGHVVMYIGNNQIIGANGGNSKTHGDDPKACVSIKNISYCWNKTVSIRRLAE